MKFCQDEGQTHFLRPWLQSFTEIDIPAGGEDSLYLLARGEPWNFEVSFGTSSLSLQLCKPCDLGVGDFRWMEAKLPRSEGSRKLTLRLANGLGALAADDATGQPVIRVSDGSPPDVLVPSYDDPSLPAKEIRRLLPPHLGGLRNPDWRDAWSIAMWIHAAWTYRNTHQGQSYCPWRIEDILSWTRLKSGPDGTPAIAMCVHYAVAFLQCCLAMGTPARLLPLMHFPNSDNGHFVTEVWSRALHKWVLIDSQAGLCYLDQNGVPLNAREVARLEHPRDSARRGAAASLLKPVGENFAWPYAYLPGLFRHIGVWRWSDFYARPEHGAVGHGTTAYAEIAILWLQSDWHPPMFPFSLSTEAYLAAPECDPPKTSQTGAD